ncbi:hypothetical protein CHS0354_032901 [Potamilus streckersoni]|uniref:NACHT domain-containing protein n=1 Tax=Potamilus streckersoni TaxID=2493646 RepID=A0AAE0RWA4_9BIVA|nr:hypothetical protein CHS0354_032901 [Potamilus streckersoni]
MKKKRLGGEFRPRKNPVFHIAVCLIILIVSRCGGSFDNVSVCEYENAGLTWRSIPSNVINKAVFKEDILVVSWPQELGFNEGPSYKGRLMQEGENGFRIIKVTQSDIGTYKLMYNSPQTNGSSEYINLQVIVPPTNCCIPNITRQGDILEAKLPQECCGIPMLTPKWMNSGNASILNTRLQPGTYTACADGMALKCFRGNVDGLCANFTLDALHTQNENISMLGVLGVVMVVLGSMIGIGLVIFLVYRKRKHICGKCHLPKEEDIVEYNPDERNFLMVVEDSAIASEEPKMTLINLNKENASVEEETFPKGVQAIKRHLINQYRTMTAVSLSPCYEENLVDVSEVYCDLDIISLGEDVEGIEYINPTVATYKEILCGEDKNVATTDSICPIPAMILGECGSGKSSWCKNVVSKWCQYHDNNEMNLKESDLGVPELARFDILLYIALENKGEGLSFLEYVRNTFFYKGSDYFEKIISCSSQHRVSILLLIDGFDEVTCDLEASLNLLRENKQCSIVVTSRSSHLDCLQLKPLRLFQIQGMSPSRSKEYTKKVLDILSERRVEKLNVDLFWKFAKHIQVLHMCHLPFQCLSLIMFWIESKALSVDLTDVLLTVIEYYLRRAMTRKKFKANICQILEQQHFDISIFIAKTKHKQYLRDHGYLLKVISSIAEKLWYLQMQVGTDENSAENEPNTKDSGIDVKLCVETGILKKSFREKMGKKNPHITFSHPMLFDFFVASSIALEKRDLCTKYMTTTKAVVENSYMIHMLCQLAPNTGQEVIKGISKLKLFDENNKNDMDTERMLTNQKIICNIQCKDPLLQGGAPVRWLQTLIYTDELSSEKLSILTEGLKFTKELTVFLLQLYENRNECIFRLPILPKLQAFLVDIENCTLLLHEEREWSKEIFSELHKFVLKSVKIDVKTTGYIVEALGSSRDLRTLELCPKDDTEEPSLCDQKTSLSWGCLSKGITCMTKLRIVRLHNLRIGKHLSTLIDSLCRCLMLEILDLLNLKEVETEQIPSINTSDRRFCECMHHKKEQLGEFKSSKKSSIPKTVQLTKNAMSGKSWLTLSNHLGTLSPSILYIDQVHQSGMVLHELFQGIGRCKNLTILSICCISAGNDLVDFSSLRALQKLKKLTLCKITLPDSSWTELYKVIGKLTKLKEISLAHLEMKTCFIKVQKLSKLMLLEMREIELEETSWTKLADKIISLPKLKKLQLISCKMSRKGYSHFFDTMKHSSLHMDSTQAFNIGEGGMLSLDMVVTSD